MIILLLAPLSHAWERDPWTPRDTVLQTAVLGLFWVDYRQTLAISAGEHLGYSERNPMMGEHPTRREVTRYFAGAAIIHTAVAAILPKDARLFLQAATIGVEFACISNNYRLGIAIRF